jgi:hypothetical protein
VQFPLPRLDTLGDVQCALDAVLQAVAGGLLTVEEGAAMSDIVGRYAEPIMRAARIDARLAAIEAEQKRH